MADGAYEYEDTEWDSGAESSQDLLNKSSGGSSGFSKFFDNLLGAGGKMLDYASNNPLQSLLIAGLLGQALRGSGSNQPTTAGYKGGINMGLRASRVPSNVPKMDLYSGKPVYGPTGGGVTYAAQGGLMGLARGRYLQGPTDGMADKLNTSIDNKQPAKLSHGEFVIPADVVSHLGNGNSDAGAQKLYQMMDRVRMARTGTKRQGKQINPNKFMPGGAVEDAKYVDGGPVAFADGGTTTSTSNIAEWAGPYVTDYLSKAQALAQLPYQSFSEWSGGAPLTAGESPLQTQAYRGLAGLTTPGQFQTATDYLTRAGQRASEFNFRPQNVSAPDLKQYQMSGPKDVTPKATEAAQLGEAPKAEAQQFTGPSAVGFERASAQGFNAPEMQAAQTGYAPNLQTYQMGPAERVGTQGFDTGAAQGLMSPYMQSVVERQQQAAQREADIQAQTQAAQFAKSGAFGGARQGIERARAAEALARQKGDIQAQGLQSAYQQAQQQFNTQQQQAMQAALANQQAGLTTGQQNLAAQLGVQQLGTQTGMQTALANLNNQQQAAVQNQAAQLQSRGMNAQQALQAALANQQAGMQTGQFNAQQAYNTALQNAQLRQQTELANQGLLGQYGLQQGQFTQGANLQSAQQALQAALANQQMGYNVGQQNLQALLGVQQLGSGQDLQAQLANQQAAQNAANLNLQANQQLMGAGQGLGTLGQGQFGTQLQGLQALLGAGGQQQQTAQQGINALMNEYKQQQMWPYQQLQFQQSMLQGLPVSAYTATQPGASTLQNLTSIGMGLGGLSQMFPNFFKSTP